MCVEDNKIYVNSIGKVEIVFVDEILFFKVVGDYVEIKFDSGKEILYYVMFC